MGPWHLCRPGRGLDAFASGPVAVPPPAHFRGAFGSGEGPVFKRVWYWRASKKSGFACLFRFRFRLIFLILLCRRKLKRKRKRKNIPGIDFLDAILDTLSAGTMWRPASPAPLLRWKIVRFSPPARTPRREFAHRFHPRAQRTTRSPMRRDDMLTAIATSPNRGCGVSSKIIQRTAHLALHRLHHMGIDFRRRHIRVPQPLLDRADVHPFE